MGSNVDVVVIGAGISGLVAATALEARGRSVIVLDKGRGVGGRMATRRGTTAGAVFDHGAQCISWSRFPGSDSTRLEDELGEEGVTPLQPASVGDELQRILSKARAAEVLREWTGLPDGSFVGRHFFGRDGMTTLPKRLAEGLDVRLDHRVHSLDTSLGVWSVHSSDGAGRTLAPIAARHLLVTCPVPQALELWERSGVALEPSARAALDFVRYQRTLTLLLELEGPSEVPAPGAILPGSEPIAWVADNAQKGISETPTLTLHAAPLFSRAYWDDLDSAARILSRHAQPWIGSDVRSVQVHRWRYAHPVRRHPERCLHLAGDHPVAFAGDSFGTRSAFYSQVEEAALSGLAAVRALLGER